MSHTNVERRYHSYIRAVLLFFKTNTSFLSDDDHVRNFNIGSHLPSRHLFFGDVQKEFQHWVPSSKPTPLFWRCTKGISTLGPIFQADTSFLAVYKRNFNIGSHLPSRHLFFGGVQKNKLSKHKHLLIAA